MLVNLQVEFGRIREAFSRELDLSSCLKRAYIDNIACILMDEFGLEKEKERRDAVAERILNLVVNG